MLAKRIIPCLDVQDGMTVKGVNFESLRFAGDPVDLAIRYSREGADELVFLDITASAERRTTMLAWVKKVAESISIPFTVGGGITNLADVEALLRVGADKIAINSSAIYHPELITQIAQKYGSQCVVVAIDAKQEVDGTWRVYAKGGREKTSLELFTWAKQCEALGAGEILFTTMNGDGTQDGFACDAIRRLSDWIRIPIIASGGAGNKSHFRDVFLTGRADAALAASVFHYNTLTIEEVKAYLRHYHIPVNL